MFVLETAADTWLGKLLGSRSGGVPVPGEEIAGKPVVILSPRGRGNVMLFAINPMWRMNTQGMYALVMNAVFNWDKLR